MDTKTIFVPTSKGEDEIEHKTSLLYGDIKRALSMVDGVSTFAEISKRAAPSLRSILAELIKELVLGGFVQDKARVGFGAKIVTPPKMSVPTGRQTQSGESELDFTSVMRAPSAEILRAEAMKFEAEKARLEAAQKTQQVLEAKQVQLAQEEAVRIEAAAVLMRAEDLRRAQEYELRLKLVQDAKEKEIVEAEKIKVAQAAQLKLFAEAKAKQDAEAERLKIELAAKHKLEADARLKQEAELVRLKAEQDAVKAKLLAEQQAKALAESAKLKAEQEARLKIEAESKARQEAEAARLKVEQEILKVKQAAEQQAKELSTALKLQAEQEAKLRVAADVKAQREAEAYRIQVEQDALQAKKEADRHAKAQAEFARLKADQELEKARKDAELAKQKAELEANAREFSERRAREHAEAARLKAEQDAAQLRAELEAVRLKADSAAKERIEAEAKIKQEAAAAAIQAKHEAEAVRVKAEQAANLAREEADRIKQQAAAQAVEATKKIKQDAEKARLQAEQDAAKARADLLAVTLKVEQESKARMEAEIARLQAEQAARLVNEQIALQDRTTAANLAIEQLALQAREEEQKRAKQFALAAASTQTRMKAYDGVIPPELAPRVQLEAVDLDALVIKPQEKSTPVLEPVVIVKTTPVAAKSASYLPSEQAGQVNAQVPNPENKRIEEESARKMADTQAKAWAEAERRAAEAAKAHVAAMSQQAAVQIEQAKTPYMRPKPKSSFTWGRIIGGFGGVIFLVVLVVPMVIPTQKYATQLELSLSAKLHQPVHIGKLSARVFPTPRIDLSEVYIGEVKQIKAQQAQFSFGFSALFSEAKRISQVELLGAELNGNGLLDVPVWLQQLSSDSKYPFTRVLFNHAKLNGDAVQISDLEGEVNFDSAGQFSNALLRANGGKLLLNVKVTADKKYATVFNLHNSVLPILPNWSFEDLTANGELSQFGWIIHDFDGRIAGGVLQGEARLDWQNGWSAQGELTAKTVNLTNLNKLLEGEMSGVAHFKMQSESLAKLTDNATLDGSFVAKKGIINGVDIVETARLHSKQNIPGGRTHFDELSSGLAYNNNVYHFKSLKIINSVLSSTANIEVNQAQLSGRMSSHLSIDGAGSVDLQVGGLTDNPSLKSMR